jgi:enterobacteria phage integrase
MPRKRPPFVELWRDRHGKTRVYFRKGRGPRIPLPAGIGSPEFEEAYQRALAGVLVQAKDTPRPGAVGAGTVAALIMNYMRSAAYLNLRKTTKAGYASRIETLRVEHGHRSVSGLTRERIVAVLAPYADRPGAALSILKMLRILIRHAIETGWLTHDPSIGIKRPKGGEIRAWTEAEVEQFRGHWEIGTNQRLAFELMLYIGQRRSDVHRMTWADITNGSIRQVQQKTGAKLDLPFDEELAAALGAIERKHVTIINTELGRPYTVDGFSGWMRGAIAAAGLPLDCQPHGLRKTKGVRLAEAGCSAHEIMAWLGHKTLAEAERYCRQAEQAKLARSAAVKLREQKAHKNAQTDPNRFGQIVKK